MKYNCLAKSNYVKIRDLNFHYLTWGNPDKPKLFLLHGFMDHAHTFDLIAEELAKDFYLIAWDARGFGKTDWVHPSGYYHFFEYVYDLELFLNSFTEEKITFIAHSMGGLIASLYAGIYPERVAKIVNLEGWFIMKSTFTEAPLRLKRWIEDMKTFSTPKAFHNLEEALLRVKKNDPMTPETFMEHWVEESVIQKDEKYYWRHDAIHKTRSPQVSYPEQVKEFFNKIDCPLLLLKGDTSPFGENNFIDGVDFFKTKNVVEIKNAGHNLHLHQPAIVSSYIKDFLSK